MSDDLDRDARMRTKLENTAASLEAATATNDAALSEIGPAPTVGPIIIADPLALDIALASAAPGAVLTLASTLRYSGLLTLHRPVTLRGEVVPPGRMTADVPVPTLDGGLHIEGDDITIVGVGVRHGNPLTDIATISGARTFLDRCRVQGDPRKGAKRGIAANGKGDCVIVRCFVDDCFQAYPGNDSQAICAWDMGPGLRIEDCYLAGGSETVMIGGADPSTEARAPRQITIKRNTITKHPDWQFQLVGVKNALELKNAREVIIEDNEISYAWGGHGQDGFLLMLTPRNQDGRAPTSTVEDVEVRGNRFSHGGSAISILGTDNVNTSGRLQRVKIYGNIFTDLDALAYAGSKKLIQIQRGPLDLSITGNVFESLNHTSVLYFDGLPMSERLTVTGNTWPKTKYGVFGSGASVGKAWQLFVASGTFANNIEVTV